VSAMHGSPISPKKSPMLRAVKEDKRWAVDLLTRASQEGLGDTPAALAVPLNYLAFRNPSLALYEQKAGPLNPKLALGPWLPASIRCQALVICGSAMTAVPMQAADLFVDVLYPAGCRTVILTGGGLRNVALCNDLVERELTAAVGAKEPWPIGKLPKTVTLQKQGVSKPVLEASATVPTSAEDRQRFCSEADVMLELFVLRCSRRGLEVHFGGDETATDDGSLATPSSVPRAYVERKSQTTGESCAFSRALLGHLGHDLVAKGANVAIVQHPQAQLRTVLTWEKQAGKSPMAWCPRPSAAELEVSLASMLLYALGEFQCIQKHASEGICLMPPDFPFSLVGPLGNLEPLLRKQISEECVSGGWTAYPASLGIGMDLVPLD